MSTDENGIVNEKEVFLTKKKDEEEERKGWQ
jgi:hypothetical protein